MRHFEKNNLLDGAHDETHVFAGHTRSIDKKMCKYTKIVNAIMAIL